MEIMIQDNRAKQDPNEVKMKSLKEWREEEQIDEFHLANQNPMQIVQNTMSRIAPIVQMAHKQIEGWPEEREKRTARRTLDAQLLKASRDQWMGKARMAVTSMDRGMDASRALKRFGGVNTSAANQLAQ